LDLHERASLSLSLTEPTNHPPHDTHAGRQPREIALGLVMSVGLVFGVALLPYSGAAFGVAHCALRPSIVKLRTTTVQAVRDEIQRLESGAADPEQTGYEPWLLPKPKRSIDEQRRSRSPGIANNFEDLSTTDFKAPYGNSMAAGEYTSSAPDAPPDGSEPLFTRVERLEGALAAAAEREMSLLQRLDALEAVIGTRPVAATPAPAPPAPAPVAGPGAPLEPPEVAEMLFGEVMRMAPKAIKDELTERRVEFADCFDKESLADRLVKARMGLVSAAPPPPAPPSGPRPDYQSGVESRPGEEDDLEDAFKAAGWTGNAEPSPVDTRRSPGLNRNFMDVPTSDFKKPYNPSAGRKGRYG
jgi:hypothetical protein